MNMYSLEIKKKVQVSNLLGGWADSLVNWAIKYIPVGEFFFVHNPLQYSESVRYRVSVDPTFGRDGSNIITDYGIDNGSINISGEFNLNFKGRPEVTSPLAIPLLNAVGYRTGKQEFIDFMGLLFYSRYTIYIPATVEMGLTAGVLNIQNFSHDSYALIWNDYDRNRRVEVVPSPNGFSFSRNTEDSFTIKFQGEFIVVKDINAEMKIAGVIGSVIRNPIFAIDQLQNLVQSCIDLPLSFTGYGIGLVRAWDRLKTWGADLQSSYLDVKDQFNKEGQLISKKFNTQKVDRALNSVSNKYEKFTSQKLGLDNTQTLTNNQKSVNPSVVSLNAKKLVRDASQIQNGVGTNLLCLPGETLEQKSIDANGSDFTKWILIDNYEPIQALIESGINIQANMLLSEMDNNFRYVQANSGESLEQFSERVLGDDSFAYQIAEFNNISIFDDITGLYIKVPDQNRFSNVLSLVNPISEKTLNIRVMGEDLALTDDRGLAISFNGDLDIVRGNDCLVSNLIDMIETPTDSLPIHSEWGNPYNIGEVIDINVLSTLADRMALILQSDSRVNGATVDNLSIDDDSLQIDFSLTNCLQVPIGKIRYNPKR